MNVDLTLPLKEDVVKHLVKDGSLTALVPATSIYGIQTPTNVKWPYIRTGVPISGGYEASCWEGSSVEFTLHAFAEPSPGIAGETRVLQIAALIVAAMDNFQSDRLGVVENTWRQTVVLLDDSEADRWHAVVTFAMTVVRKDLANG